MLLNSRWTRAGLLIAVLPLAAACATPGERVEQTGEPAQILRCDRTSPPAQSRRFEVGPPGGRLDQPPHSLDVPAFGLAGRDTIALFEPAGDTVGLRITSTARRFLVPARITISAERCGTLPAGEWAIWRLREGREPQRLRTRQKGMEFTARFNEHSGFIIASRF